MKHYMKIIISVSLGILITAFLAIGRQPDIFSITAKDQSLKNVLDTINAKTTINIIYSGQNLEHTVSIDMQDIDIESALRRTLINFNYTTIWHTHSNTVSIFVYGIASKDTKLLTSKITDRFVQGTRTSVYHRDHFIQGTRTTNY